jgi:WD40 repeat protein
VTALALDPSGRIAVTGSADGIVRAGPVTGGEPHLLYGHEGRVATLAVSPDGQWIASGGQDGLLRLWPMPDVSRPPFHTWPHDALLSTLRALTNVRVVADAGSETGYKLHMDPFPGWAKTPTW